MSARIEDRLALRELVDRYAFALDGRDAEEFVALFIEDAVVTIIEAGTARQPRIRKGRSEIGIAVPRMAERYVQTFHLVGQQLVEFSSPQAATGQVYCIANHIDSGGANRVVHLRYDDVYALGAGGWLFASRRLVFGWEERRPLSNK